MTSQIFRASAIISVCLLVGRFSGFLRELLIARAFHTTATADTVVLLLAVPDLFNALLSVTTVGALMLPALSAENVPQTAVLRAFRRTTSKVSLLCLLSCLVGVPLLYGFESGRTLPCLLAALSVPANFAAAVYGAHLQFHNRFALQSLGTLIFNSIFILFLLTVASPLALAFGVVAAAGVRTTLLHIRSTSLLDDLAEGRKSAPLETNYSVTARAFGTVILTTGALSIIPTVDKLFASFLPAGAASVLSYSEKLYMLPISVVLTAPAVAAFPQFSRHAAEGQWIPFEKLLGRALRQSALLSSVTAAVALLLAAPIVQAIYGTVSLPPSSLSQITLAFRASAGLIVCSGLNALLVNGLFAMSERKLVSVYGMTLLLAKVTTNLICVTLGTSVAWIAASTSALTVIGTAFLYYAIHRQLRVASRAERTQLPSTLGSGPLPVRRMGGR